jgi:hypothetical protein
MGTSIRVLIGIFFLFSLNACSIYNRSQARKQTLTQVFDETKFNNCIAAFYPDTADVFQLVCGICQEHQFFMIEMIGNDISTWRTIENLKSESTGFKPNVFSVSKACLENYESPQYKKEKKRFIKEHPYRQEQKFFTAVIHHFFKKQKKNEKRK